MIATFAALAGWIALMGPGLAQAATPAQTGVVRLEVTLVDTDLRLRPVPRHVLRFSTGGGASPLDAVTDAAGRAEVHLAAGTWDVESTRPVEFQGRSYRWSRRLTVQAGAVLTIELSSDSALTTEAPSGARLPELFRDLRDSVVTVWSEARHGTGFLVDAAGLIVTCDHVLGAGEYAAVQFTPTLKVAAQVVARDRQKDVAFIRVHPSHVAGLAPIRVASAANRVALSEGQQVFTIGSPLNLQRVMTSGIVSKVDPTIVLTDIAVLEGNSGGPLITLEGVAVGLTAFRGSDPGARISGAMRLDAIEREIAAARAALDTPPPSDDVLPVEPVLPFPVVELAARLDARPVKPDDYQFGTSAFSVTMITPVLTYGVDTAARRTAARERAKRGLPAESVAADTGSFDEFKDWGAYIGGFRPVLIIDVRPRLGEGFMSAFGRTFGARGRMHFKAEFLSMQLLCGDRAVPPIHPGRILHNVNVETGAMTVVDQTAEGLYVYGPGSIGPHCGTVTIAVTTRERPERPETTLVPAPVVTRIWDDFAPYRALAGRDTPHQ